MGEKRVPVYIILLHTLLVALAAVTLLLARDNRELRARLTPPPATPPFQAGDVIEPFDVIDLDGQIQTVDLNQGDRDQILLFFTTTCPACLENQSNWSLLHDRLGYRANVVAVSFDGPEETKDYKARLELPFPIVTAPDTNTLADQLGVYSVPATVHVAADGRVRESWTGVLAIETVHAIAAAIPDATGAIAGNATK